jgi:hypothetical protein
MKEVFENDNLIIESNLSKGWDLFYKNHNKLIYLHRKVCFEGHDSHISFGLKDIDFIIKTLQEIKEYYDKNAIKIGDKVKIINGRMSGLQGKVSDIAYSLRNTPLEITIEEEDFAGVCFCSFTDIEKVGD